MPAVLTITRTFAAPRERVWEMWTRPEHFAAWFGTQQITVPLESVTMDVRVGGRWTATMELPDGMTILWDGEYTEVDPPSHLALTMNDDPRRDAGLPVVVEFLAVDGGTQMTLTQSTPEFSDEQHAATIVGYTAFFDDLEALLPE